MQKQNLMLYGTIFVPISNNNKNCKEKRKISFFFAFTFLSMYGLYATIAHITKSKMDTNGNNVVNKMRKPMVLLCVIPFVHTDTFIYLSR